MSPASATILIVEDEAVTRATLRALFEGEGYRVAEAANGDEMYQQLTEQPIDLLIMDINLPGKNGLLLAREVRTKANAEMGLIFLTGRDNDVDRILGLEIGADHYLTKPFNPRELAIRARNLLSRVRTPPQHKDETPRYQFNGWLLDNDSRRLIPPQGSPIRLPRSEFRALRLLLSAPGKVFSRDALLMEMAGRVQQPHDRTVDVTIRRLRKHFESIPGTPELVDTVHGEGYRFSGSLQPVSPADAG
ncbi:MAG: two-component system response regulator ArcA [Corallincola sp.]|nr:two-component system response regulator ArcA [Corallincola sp.]